MKNPVRALLALLLLLGAAAAGATSAIGAAALRARHATLAPQMADNVFGEPIHLQSAEANNRIDGDVYAVLDHPFAVVSSAMADPGRWCDVLILHLNTKYCRRVQEGPSTRLEVRVGRKSEQPIASASLLEFSWRQPVARADYLLAEMGAPDGPYDTRDYKLLVEAIPLDGGRTFLHMGYAFSYGGAGNFAMHLYLATLAAGKVGFTVTQPAPAGGEPEYVGGMRGVIERNTMRYYLAIRSYLDSLALPASQQLDKRLRAWFDATEKYPRQLHEVDRDSYLRMKRNEVQRQAAPQS